MSKQDALILITWSSKIVQGTKTVLPKLATFPIFIQSKKPYQFDITVTQMGFYDKELSYLTLICCHRSGSLFHLPAYLIIPYDDMLLDLRANIRCVSVLCLQPLFSVFSMIFVHCYSPFSFLEKVLEIYIPPGVQLVTNMTTRWCICFPIVKQWDCSSTNWHKVELFPTFFVNRGSC